jgi:hypothetical protein
MIDLAMLFGSVLVCSEVVSWVMGTIYSQMTWSLLLVLVVCKSLIAPTVMVATSATRHAVIRGVSHYFSAYRFSPKNYQLDSVVVWIGMVGIVYVGSSSRISGSLIATFAVVVLCTLSGIDNGPATTTKEPSPLPFNITPPNPSFVEIPKQRQYQNATYVGTSLRNEEIGVSRTPSSVNVIQLSNEISLTS